MSVVDEAVVEGVWEYRRLQLPPGISRRAAAIHAEFAGWELSTVRLYSDPTARGGYCSAASTVPASYPA